MPRYSSRVRSYSPSTSGVTSELGIVWSSSGGHTHDGVESSLINGESYSLFDFRPTNRVSTIDRSNIQERNREALKSFIVNTIKEDYIEFNNILLGPDVIGAQNIVAGSINSDLIAANTIVANNIAANTITTELLATDAVQSLNYDAPDGAEVYSDAGSFLDLSNGEFITPGLRLYSNGDLYISNSVVIGGTTANTVVDGAAAGANAIPTGGAASDINTANVTVSGTKITSNSITTAQLATDSIKSTNYSYSSGSYSTAGTFFNLTDGSITSQQFAIDSSGNASFAGDISGGTITIGSSNDVFKVNSFGDMWLGHAVKSSAEFRVSRSGDLFASSATITGTINATAGYIGNATTGFDIASTSITSHDYVSSGDSRGKLRLYSYGDIFIDSSPTSGVHNGQDWQTSLVGEWLEIKRTSGTSNYALLGNTDGSDNPILNLVSTDGSPNIYLSGQKPYMYMWRNQGPETKPSDYNNQVIRLYNHNNNSSSVIGIGFALANGSGCVLRAWQGNLSANAYIGSSGTSSGYGSGGDGLDVGSRDGQGYGFMGASAFVVRSSETIKKNIEYLPTDTRTKSIDRIKALQPVRWDDLVGAKKSIIDEETGMDVEVVEHNCDNEDCGGTSENPCGVYSFHKGRYGFIAEDVAKVFPKAVQMTSDNKPIGIDYAPITFSLVETVQVLLEQIEELKVQIQALSE